MAQKNKKNNLSRDEFLSPSKFNTLLVNETLIDTGIIGFDIDLPAFANFIGRENFVRVKRVVVSHGHFDQWNHIGIFEQMPGIPFYMGVLTQALMMRSAEFEGEMALSEIAERAEIIDPGDIIDDEIETFALSHSIPQTMGMLISGKQGLFVYFGDFRLKDYREEEKEETLALLKEIGDNSVEIVAFSIFNAHIPGSTPVEQLAIDELSCVIAKAPAKVVITCFSTNLARI
jgi:ribonuclease J